MVPTSGLHRGEGHKDVSYSWWSFIMQLLQRQITSEYHYLALTDTQNRWEHINNSLIFFFRSEIFSKAKTNNMILGMLRKPPSFITNRGIIPEAVSLRRLEIKSWFSNQQAALTSHYAGQLAIPSILLASSFNRLSRVPFPWSNLQC